MVEFIFMNQLKLRKNLPWFKTGDDTISHTTQKNK